MFPSFRVVAIILVVAGVSAYFVLSDKAERERKQQAAQKTQEDEQHRAKHEAEQRDYCDAKQKQWTIVPVSQVEIRNPSLTQDRLNGSINDDFSFTTSVKSKSKSKMTASRMNVTALDCPTQDARAADCEAVGRSDETFNTDIPARQIRGKFTMRDVPQTRGVFSPKFAVIGVRASTDVTLMDDLLAKYLYTCD
jgi:hypothetical protein